MPLELCPKCKGMHYKNAPCIVRTTKSTAARKADVQRSGTAERSQVTGPVVVSSGISAPPVETSANLTREVTAGETASKFDKKTWMREYMRDHRKGIKRRAAQKEAGK